MARRRRDRLLTVASAQFVLPAKVDDDAVIVVDDPARYAGIVKALAGKRIELVIRKPKSKRSLDQNAWWWGVAVPMIAESLGYDRHEYEQVHYALVSKCFGVRHDPRLGEVPNARSSQLTVQEFADLMDWSVRWAAEFCGVVLPLPNEANAA